MTKIKAAIVDDEPLARRRIVELLQRDNEIDIVAECCDGLEAIEFVEKSPPDLLFLDVQMPEMSGFEVVSRLSKETVPVIVFVTAYDQYAIKAFEVNALDYLLKPFDDERFGHTVERAKRYVTQRAGEELSQKLMHLIQTHEQGLGQSRKAAKPVEEYIDRFAIKERGEAILVKADDVEYFEGEGVYVRLHLNGKSYLIRERMAELERRLNPKLFFRTHRSSIVNLERIQKFVPHFHGDYIIVLQDGTRLKLSRTRRDALQQRLGTCF